MSQKIIARFPSRLEAEAAVNCLEAGGVPALATNSIVGGMMPHASSALGGFTVSVESAHEAKARELLRGVDTDSADPAPRAEAPSAGHEVGHLMKRAAYGAVLGSLFLPVIANLLSLWLYFKAYRRDPQEFRRRKGILMIGMLFNLAILIGIPYLVLRGLYSSMR